MRRMTWFLLVALVVGLPAALAGPAPLTLTVKSYQAFATSLQKVVDTAVPGAGEDALNELREELGLGQLAGVDKQRPWQIAVWVEDPSSEPSVSLRIPVSDFAVFKAGIEETGLADASDVVRIEKVADYANIWIEHGEPTETTKTAHAGWKPDQLGGVDTTLRLDLVPTDALRQVVLQIMGMARFGITSALSGAQGQNLPGVDPKVMVELMGVYFDVIETGIKGLDKLSISLDARTDSLALAKQITALTGSDLATWLKGSAGSLDSVMPFLSDDAPAAVAMRVGGSPAFLPLLKKFMRLSLQMQGMTQDSNAVLETEKLIESMMPFRAAGSVDLKKGVGFAGAYQFPGRSPKELYDLTKKFLVGTMQSQVGEDKPYKAITFKDAAFQVAGVNVDRATLELNLDSPLYQMPGQKELVDGMWPGGKMILDYAVQGENLLVASEGRMSALLSRPATAPAPRIAYTANTVACGRINFLELARSFLTTNPMVPEDVKGKLGTLETAGTDVTFAMDLDGSLKAQAIVPLKAISSVSKAFAE